LVLLKAFNELSQNLDPIVNFWSKKQLAFLAISSRFPLQTKFIELL
jgi:hypothetical protein